MLLVEQSKAMGLTDESFSDMVDNTIRTCTFPNPTIGQFLGYFHRKPEGLHGDLFWVDGIGECLKPNPNESVVTWTRYLNTLKYQGRPIDYRVAANYFHRYPTTWATLPKEITAQYEQQV